MKLTIMVITSPLHRTPDRHGAAEPQQATFNGAHLSLYPPVERLLVQRITKNEISSSFFLIQREVLLISTFCMVCYIQIVSGQILLGSHPGSAMHRRRSQVNPSFADCWWLYHHVSWSCPNLLTLTLLWLVIPQVIEMIRCWDKLQWLWAAPWKDLLTGNLWGRSPCDQPAFWDSPTRRFPTSGAQPCCPVSCCLSCCFLLMRPVSGGWLIQWLFRVADQTCFNGCCWFSKLGVTNLQFSRETFRRLTDLQTQKRKLWLSAWLQVLNMTGADYSTTQAAETLGIGGQ